MTPLLKKILKTRPRESSGATSSNRFSFQHSWAMCKLLDLHLHCKPYMILFEFHDDIVVLDDEDSPVSAEFIQVKTDTTGRKWTCSKLLSRKKGKGRMLPSPLGKLRCHEISFSKFISRMSFVSNASFNVPLSDETKSTDRNEVCLSEMTDEARREVKDKLRQELCVDTTGESKTFLCVTDLSVEDHEVHSLGKLTSFLEQSRLNVTASVLHKSLGGEIRRRSGNERFPSSVEELKRGSAITRRDFSGMLDSAEQASVGKKDALVQTTRERLNSESVPHRRVSRVCRSLAKYLVMRTDQADAVLTGLNEKIRKIRSELGEGRLPDMLWDETQQIQQLIFTHFPIYKKLYEEEFVTAAILVCIYEQEEL